MIGRFSCLSCANVANITSYYNGVKYSYIMYKNGTGINIDKICEEKGDFKNGLEVSIKVQVYNTEEITGSISKLCLFDMLHVTYIGENDRIKSAVEKFNLRTVVHCDTFSLCDRITYGTYLRLGNVLYDLDSSLNILNTNGIIVNIPFGEVAITPNRESIQLTEKSKNTITESLMKVKSELQELVDDQLSGDMDIRKYFINFVDSYYLKVDMENKMILSISNDDVDLSNIHCTIDGKEIPKHFIDIISSIRYKGFPKEAIYKTYLCRRGGFDLFRVLAGKITLFRKGDSKMNGVTLQYLNETINKPTVMLNCNGLNRIINDCKDYCKSSYVGRYDNYGDVIDFIFSCMKVSSFSNADVPDEYIENYKEERKLERLGKKKTVCDLDDVSVRRYYCDTGYYLMDFRNLPKNGLILYSSNRNGNDKNISSLTALQETGAISAVITLKKEYIPYVEQLTRFMLIEDFLTGRNKILEKLATVSVIKANILPLRNTPLWREFCAKYKTYIECYYSNDFIDGLVRNYVDKGWVNNIDVKYFSLNENERNAWNEWTEKKGNWEKIIRKIMLIKYGNINKIGLTI